MLYWLVSWTSVTVHRIIKTHTHTLSDVTVIRPCTRLCGLSSIIIVTISNARRLVHHYITSVGCIVRVIYVPIYVASIQSCIKRLSLTTSMYITRSQVFVILLDSCMLKAVSIIRAFLKAALYVLCAQSWISRKHMHTHTHIANLSSLVLTTP